MNAANRINDFLEQRKENNLYRKLQNTNNLIDLS